MTRSIEVLSNVKTSVMESADSRAFCIVHLMLCLGATRSSIDEYIIGAGMQNILYYIYSK